MEICNTGAQIGICLTKKSVKDESIVKIIEWNINHRLGYSNKEMPTWVKTVIQDKKTDIIVLTETSFKVPNWEVEYRAMFDRNEYYVFCSNNTDVGNNEVTIAIKKSCFSVEYVKSFLSKNGDHKYPDHLEVYCIHKETNKKIVIIGMRIHALNISDKQKKKEFESVLKSVEREETVMIAGDFNNKRRGYKDPNHIWCLDEVQQLAESYGFSMYTPLTGGSIYEDNDGDYSFPEDHIFIKGHLSITSYNYDRTFVTKDTGVYKWGTNFTKYLGKDQNGNNIYDSVYDPFPDHAIIEADFDIK